MDYAEVREAFFQLRDTSAPEPGTSGWQSPARDAIGPALPGILPLLQEWSRQITEHGCSRPIRTSARPAERASVTAGRPP
jgi:hypothetical protein